ncbi:NAD/NADP octopine/nopaline dehydrogenase family protein [Cypionkella sp.]|uniref:NAD/NADP octopine/nopaline dehydrogenase family protein n=1 Tax=Cypionkella sp. TaxID=2811411 RepID=UPI002ABCAFFC|nr:NAD/NADP octopine/nopaline dehydrogenase family protein [Cypionkella sp.]MDZ4395912.1 NAD/NADP octopine/nopaline dehydrogenase family protein [Cypionkella sp.]
MAKRVLILGAGGVARGMAALLTKAGHVPMLWSPSGRSTQALRSLPLQVSGALDGALRIAIAQDLQTALHWAEVVVLAMPANGHRATLDAALPHLRADHGIIISAQLSLGGLYLHQALAARGVAALVMVWGTTVVLGRCLGEDGVQIGGLRARVEVAALPDTRSDEALALCHALFGDRFGKAESIVAIALGNLNPPVHMANALCNLTRIERGEVWANYDGITPAVARLIEGLDGERLALAAAYGVRVRSVERHFRDTFALPEHLSLAEMAAQIHARRGGPPGPTDLSTRFITEDLPFGIVEIITLAQHIQHPTPLHEAGLTLFQCLCGRDFRAENTLLPALDFAAISGC